MALGRALTREMLESTSLGVVGVWLMAKIPHRGPGHFGPPMVSPAVR